MPVLILTVMTATLPIAPASPQERANPPRKEQIEELPPPPGLPPRKEQTEEPAKTVKELQKERIATLKRVAVMLTELFEKGERFNVSLDEVVEARLLVLKAELDAAEKESDRITLYKDTVDVLKQYEKLAKSRVEGARGTVVTVLKVKARRLEAEINLERAKAKKAKEGK